MIYEYNPATAARQGRSVAATLVDSCEIRTAWNVMYHPVIVDK
jgi:hypothetical protein